MSVVLITGMGGLVGSEAADYFAAQGYTVLGIENNLRAQFFGTPTYPRVRELEARWPKQVFNHAWDIRSEAVTSLIKLYGNEISLIIHAAAQPSHDYAAQHPRLDWGINADGTLNLLEAMREYAPEAVFVFMSTNKVYGDRPNLLAYEEHSTRYEPVGTEFREGFDETMSIDACLHSLFGASKLAADVLAQEYGRYFGLRTVCLRAGCLTGAHHAGAEQHGFLSYLMWCVRVSQPYAVYGYQGKQVRDNLHARDLAMAFDALWRQPPPSGTVYNLGGGRANSLSVLEAIERCEEITGHSLAYSINPTARRGDHQWWITDTTKFRHDYPAWRVTWHLPDILAEMAGRKAEATA